jgi:hypothetical protein
MRMNLCLFCTLDVCAAALANRMFGEGGIVVLVLFATIMPSFVGLLVIGLFLSNRAFDGLALFSFLNVLAVITWENYFFGVYYSGAV